MNFLKPAISKHPYRCNRPHRPIKPAIVICDTHTFLNGRIPPGFLRELITACPWCQIMTLAENQRRARRPVCQYIIDGNCRYQFECPDKGSLLKRGQSQYQGQRHRSNPSSRGVAG
ncbi:MAG: hypothetical protein KAT70_04300 [Thermoplasmata archaeon]|nr:hypothetical protein [Thermoplasmata archaeon]